MKKYKVAYIYRGSNYKFMSPNYMCVQAKNKKDAHVEAIMRVGDMYRIKSVEEIE